MKCVCPGSEGCRRVGSHQREMASGGASPDDHTVQVEVVSLRVRRDPGHGASDILNCSRSGRVNRIAVLHGDNAGPGGKERSKASGRIRPVAADPAASVDLDDDRRGAGRRYPIDVEMQVHCACRPRVWNRGANPSRNARITGSRGARVVDERNCRIDDVIRLGRFGRLPVCGIGPCRCVYRCLLRLNRQTEGEENSDDRTACCECRLPSAHTYLPVLTKPPSYSREKYMFNREIVPQ